jgi:hypothetical protein
MNSFHFLHTSISRDVANYMLGFFEPLSMYDLKAINKNYQQFIESSQHFPEANKKALRAIREFVEKQIEYKKVPQLQIQFAHLFKTGKTSLLAPIASIFRDIFPSIGKPLCLEEEIFELDCDLPISRFFGTKQEFDSLPELTSSTTHRPNPKDMPYLIMRYRLPSSPLPGTVMIEKPVLLIRLKSPLNGQYEVMSYVYLFKKWVVYDSYIPSFSLDFPEESLFSKEGNKTIHYYKLREMLLTKKFNDTSDNITYTVE